MKKLLVPLDGSSLAGRAGRVAEAIVERSGGALILLHAHWPGIPTDPGDTALDEQASRLRAKGIPVETELRPTPRDEETGRVIVETARDQQVDAIVMATHGRSGLGRWLFGSVAEQVLRLAETPVLLVPPTTPEDWPAGHAPVVILALDQSKAAERAIAPTTELARALSAELVLVQVVPGDRHDEVREARDTLAAEEYLDPIATRVSEDGLTARTVVLHGHPDRALSALATELNSYALGLGMYSKDESRERRSALGSVALGLIRRVDVPVLLVRDRA